MTLHLIKLCKHFYTSIYSHHHHVPQVWISLTLSRPFSLLFIASGRSSGPHPVSSHSCWMYVRAGRPAFARPYVEVHRSTSLMSLSLLLQQCPACPGSSNLYSFCDGRAGGRIVGALWSVATRTYSTLLATFLSSCRLASSPAVQLASKKCIHTAVSSNHIIFYTFSFPWIMQWQILDIKHLMNDRLHLKYIFHHHQSVLIVQIPLILFQYLSLLVIILDGVI